MPTAQQYSYTHKNAHSNRHANPITSHTYAHAHPDTYTYTYPHACTTNGDPLWRSHGYPGGPTRPTLSGMGTRPPRHHRARWQ